MDSPWLSAQSRVVFGHLDLPSLADLRAAFVELAAQGERTRAGFTLSPSTRHWLFDPHRLEELAEQVVVEQPTADGGRPDNDEAGFRVLESLLENTEVDNATAVHFTRADNRLVFVQNHGLGDARLSLQLPSALVQIARTGGLPGWVDAPVAAHPLRTAALRSARSGPKALAGLWRDRASGTRSGANTGRAVPPQWTPQPRTAFRVLSRTSWQQIKAWRSEYAPDSSLASLQLVIVREALTLAGLTMTPQTVVLYDCRRYLPRREQVRGNFVVARSQQLGYDPVSVSESLRTTLENAQPLATLLAATAKNALRPPRTEPAPPSAVDDECLPAFVAPPRSPEVENMPWQRSDLHPMAVSSRPPRANAVTATMFLLGGRVSASICYHPSVIADSVVHAALALIDDHPTALLEHSLIG